jgi:predicted signal transduction protein with EAL and GGDEF domain
MAPGDGTDVDQLIKHANLALHRAKQEQRGHYRFFEQDMDARMRARHELECNLRNALTGGELELNYQPLLNLKRNEIAGFEALLRWRTRSGELIPPSAFVPLAEETGLIVPMGEWALRQALAEAAKWPRQIRVAVNLSPVQFNSRNLSQIVMSALAATGVEASRLELEITESLLLQDRDTTLATLHQLRDLGVRIALDDFGTGFSSLNYLRAFPFDKLKIDQCFIDGLAEGNEESLAIVRAVARLGASLGIATTAEGVETELQMDIARREGFTEVQGFWIGVPKNAAAIALEYDLYGGSTKPRRAGAKPKSIVDAPVIKSPAEPKRRARRRRSA